jgi:hypothetical protein
MTRFYLNMSAGGLAFVALGYALIPHTSVGALVNLSLDTTDQVHILRAIMGLYLGMVCFWFYSASRPQYARAAVLSVVLFMFGLAFGRIFSMVVDGMPSPFLTGATLVEIASGVWGAIILRSPDGDA